MTVRMSGDNKSLPHPSQKRRGVIEFKIPKVLSENKLLLAIESKHKTSFDAIKSSFDKSKIEELAKKDKDIIGTIIDKTTNSSNGSTDDIDEF